MMYSAATYLYRQQGKEPSSKCQFQGQLNNTTELYIIKTKLISRHHVDIHTEKDLREWFEKEYWPALEYTSICDQEYPNRFIYNIDEKGYRIACPRDQDVVVPLVINEMYVGIPKNQLSLTVIKSICVDRTAISLVVIVLGGSIIEHQFHQNMTGYELITILLTGYTNSDINLQQLDHFIKYNNCGPDKLQRILLLDRASSYTDNIFAIKYKANKIWPVIFLSHQMHLIQPADVGCFREWKYYQQTKVQDVIRLYEPEYNVQSFFRDLSEVRRKTFTKKTIKHSFRDTGIWPISFKQVQRKL